MRPIKLRGNVPGRQGTPNHCRGHTKIKIDLLRKRSVLAAAVTAGVLSFRASNAAGASIGEVFVIALENHNFTQPGSYTRQQQIKGNTAAPFINSLITPGNPNASNVSYATNYTNSGTGVHPSQPNSIWDEAGTNYNPTTGTTILSDNDPSSANGNIFSGTPHLTGLMDEAGISWNPRLNEQIRMKNDQTRCRTFVLSL